MGFADYKKNIEYCQPYYYLLIITSVWNTLSIYLQYDVDLIRNLDGLAAQKMQLTANV